MKRSSIHLICLLTTSVVVACGDPSASSQDEASGTSGDSSPPGTTSGPPMTYTTGGPVETEEGSGDSTDSSTGEIPCDAEVSAAAVREGDGKVELSWTTTAASVRIQVRTDGSAPEGPDDGTTVYEGEETSVVITELMNGVDHQFTIFGFDEGLACGSDEAAARPNPPWLPHTALPRARTGLGGAEIDGELIVIGGVEDCTNEAYVSRYDAATDAWTEGATGPIPVSETQVVAVGGMLYGRGLQVTEYDPASDTWPDCGGGCDAPGAQRNGVAAAAHDGRIYYFGGWDPTAMASVADVHEFDPSTGGFTDCGGTCAGLPTPRRFMRAATVGDRIYVIGGLDGLEAVEEYDPATDSWTNCDGGCTSMPTGRSSFDLAVLEGVIYVFGGSQDEDEVEAFDPATNTWETKAPMPNPRLQHAAVTVGDAIYVVGGRDACCCDGTTDLVDSYTPARDW